MAISDVFVDVDGIDCSIAGFLAGYVPGDEPGLSDYVVAGDVKCETSARRIRVSVTIAVDDAV